MVLLTHEDIKGRSSSSTTGGTSGAGTERLTVGDWGEFQHRVERTLEVGQLI